MVLADTSVWIAHLKNRNQTLEDWLVENQLLMHPMIRGELSLGSIRNRTEFLAMVDHLPLAELADDQELFQFIENNRLYSKGIGWVDLSLIVSAKLSSASLYTLDKTLAKTWKSLASKP
jgi:predicted nucleic acid-binding protein